MTRRMSISMAVLVFGMTLGACGSDSDPGSAAATVAAEAASDAASAAVQLTPAQGATLLAERSDLTIIDVRTPAEFAAAHLDGAINIDVEAPDFDSRIAELATDGGYVVYCQSGRRSAIAATRMAGLGFTDVSDFGGIQDWIAAGNPVVTG